MGCCFSCLECFGIFKNNAQDARTRNYGSTRGSVRSNYTYNYDRPYNVLPSSTSLPSSSNTSPQIQSPPTAPIVRSIVPTQNNAIVPGLGKQFPPLYNRPLLPTTSSTANPSAHAQTSTGISQLNRNYQTFSNGTAISQIYPPRYCNVTSIQTAAVVTTQRATSFKTTTVPRKTAYHGAAATSTSTKRVPQTKPVNSHSFRSKGARHNAFAKRRPSLPQANSSRSVVSIPQSPGQKQDNFDAIPLLCRILTSTPENMKGRLNVAQFFSKDNWEYPVILEYINNSQAHPNFGIEVLKIIKICQRHVTEFRNRDQYDPTSHRMMLWHGSKFNNVRSILEQGLKLPEPTQGSLFGNGIYFADRVSKSAPYCNSAHSGGGCLFLCDVMLGNPYPSRSKMTGVTSPPTGYNSVKGIGKFVPGPVGRFEHRKFYGSKMSLGKTVPNLDTTLPHNYSLFYNEYVVYDPDAVNIKFLVYFKFTDKPVVNEL
ncbi:unnamed protein product [Orchesella dallaii]|uniref:Poly [ADP-ribose] polymerase n=1 Tax=Orchesella dallaii TaxID=48710 RepID=A0ABP1RD48_9HEXA